MKILTTAILVTCSALLGACTTTGTAPAGVIASAASAPSADYVVTRAFQLRRSPSVSADAVQGFRTGDRFSGRHHPIDDVWNRLWLLDGIEGYVFLQPFKLDQEARP